MFNFAPKNRRSGLTAGRSDGLRENVGHVRSGNVSSNREEATATDLSRNALSSRRLEFLMKVATGISVVLLVSVCINAYLILRPVEYRYFSMNIEGGIHELEVLAGPIQSERLVLNWTTQAVTEAFSVSFADKEDHMERIRPRFTNRGWLGFQSALKSSGFMESLVNNQVVTSAVPRGAPVIVDQGNVEGVHGWRLQLPLLVSYQSSSSNRNQELLVDVTVVRRPASENPVGLGIERIISS